MKTIDLLTPDDQEKCEQLIARLRQEYEKKPWKQEDARDFFNFMAGYLERAHGRIGEQEAKIQELEVLLKAVGSARDYVLEHMGSRAQFDRIVYVLQTQNSGLIKRLDAAEAKQEDFQEQFEWVQRSLDLIQQLVPGLTEKLQATEEKEDDE